MTRISKELIAATSGPIILSILCSGDHYGYEIIKKVKEASSGKLQWADGMLYPVLHKLEEKGQIESYWALSPEGRKRKYYRICLEGEKSLNVAKDHWALIDIILKNLWKPSAI